MSGKCRLGAKFIPPLIEVGAFFWAASVKRTGFTAVKGEYVNAPIFIELPVAAECRLLKVNEDGIIIGEIVNISADESVLGTDGLIDAEKAEFLSYEPVHSDYRVLGEKAGNAFADGRKLSEDPGETGQ